MREEINILNDLCDLTVRELLEYVDSFNIPLGTYEELFGIFLDEGVQETDAIELTSFMHLAKIADELRHTEKGILPVSWRRLLTRVDERILKAEELERIYTNDGPETAFTALSTARMITVMIETYKDEFGL